MSAKKGSNKTVFILAVVAIVLVIVFFLIPRAKGKKEIDLTQSLTNIAELSVEQLQVTKIFFLKEKSLTGSRWLVQQVNAQVRASVNVQDLVTNTKKEGEKVIVKLPQNINFDINIPPDNIKILFEDETFLRHEFSPKRIQEEDVKTQDQIKEAFSTSSELRESVVKKLQERLKVLIRGILGANATIQFI